jgi:hypothetical protein
MISVEGQNNKKASLRIAVGLKIKIQLRTAMNLIKSQHKQCWIKI